MKIIVAVTVLLLLFYPLLGDNEGGFDAHDAKRLFPALDAAQIDELVKNHELSHLISMEDGPVLAPGTSFFAKVRDDLASFDYTFGVEVVNIIPRAYGEYATGDLANMLLELSTLEGLEYFSASRGKMQTLFIQSYVIDSPESRVRVDDPAIDGVPEKGSLTVFQEDNTFGKNINTVEYEITPSMIHLITKNVSTFTWTILPIIRPGRLHMHAAVLRDEDFLIYYGNFGARSLRISLFEKRIHDSFYNRIVALYRWFEDKLER